MIWIIFALLLFTGQIAVVLINEYCRPHKAVAWLVILYAIPLFGFLIYYFAAKEYSCLHPVRQEDNKVMERLKQTIAEQCEQRMPVGPADQTAQQDGTFHAFLTKRNFFPPAAGNETTVYNEGTQAFHAMFESISAAKHHIHIEFYIIRDDVLGMRLQQLLIRKALDGVAVRLLYDGIGCRSLGKLYLKRLHDAGVETGCFFPPLASLIDKRINYRNHRKILVVDGTVGYIGGLNIGDEYLGKHAKIGYWRDTHFRIKGDAVLWIQYTFLSDWHLVKKRLLTDRVYYPLQETHGNEIVQIVKSSPDETIHELIFSLIVSSKKRIRIETPYFVPDPAVLLALKTAAIRGVEVHVIIPSLPRSDLVYCASLSYVKELLEAGIRFYRYRKGFIHAKVILCDDAACCGSTNMDMRSFTGQFEINAIFYDGKTVSRLNHDFNHDLDDSEEILPEEFENGSKIQKLREVIARMLSPLF